MDYNVGLMTHGMGMGQSGFTRLFDNPNNNTNNGPALMINQITARAMSERALTPKLAPVLSSSPSSRFKLDITLSDTSLEFGFLPKSLVVALQDRDWKVRSDSIDQFLEIAGKIDDTGAITQHLAPLIKLLNKLLNDSNFTICLTTIRIIGDLFPKLQVSIKPYLLSFLPNLIEKFGDSKIIIRQETLKVLTKLMHMVSPTPVLEIILDSCYTKHWHIKHHTLFVIIKALLMFKDHRFDYGMLVNAMIPLLHDPKPKIVYTTVEVLAIIYCYLGPQLDPMLGNLDPELVKMLYKRFPKGQLPIVCPDGSVELQLKDIEDTPPGSAAPSLPSTPYTFPRSANGSDEHDMLRPVRHWSAGAKITTRTKLPPWFPGSPGPSSPFPEDAPSSNEARKPIRARSYSISAQQERTTYNPTNLPPLSPQHAPPSPLGFHSHYQNASRDSPTFSPLKSPTNSDGPPASSQFFSPIHPPLSDSPSFENDNLHKRNNLPLEQGGRYSPSLSKLRGTATATPSSSYYPQILPNPTLVFPTNAARNPSTEEYEEEESQFKLVRRVSGSLSPSSNYPVAEKKRAPAVARRRESLGGNGSTDSIPPILDSGLLENIEDLPLYDANVKQLPTRKNSVIHLGDEEDTSGGSSISSENQSETHLHAPNRHTTVRSRSPLKSAKTRSRALTDHSSASPSPPPTHSTKQERIVNTSPSEILPTEALVPCDSPDQELKLAMDWFAHGEWYNQFEACCSVRRLVAFHPKVITTQIHDIVTVILTAANNLRSLVSRHALVCLGDMFKFLGRYLEPYLDEVVAKVIKKYNESNSFIEKELDRALNLMLDNVSETRALVVLLQVSNNKSALVRAKVAYFFSNILQIIGKRVWDMREIDKVIPIVAQLVQEGSGDCRAHGRKALYMLYTTNPLELEKLLKKVCSDSLQRRVREILDKMKTSGDTINFGSIRKPTKSATPTRTLRNPSPSPSPSPSPNLSTSPDGPGAFSHGLSLNADVDEAAKLTPSGYASPVQTSSRYGTLRQNGSLTPTQARLQDQRSGSNTPTQMTGKDPQEFESLPSIFTGMDSSEWRMRHEAIISMVELVQKYPTRIIPRLVKIFDHFTPRLTDSNSKVNVFALHSLKVLIPLLRGGLDSVLTILIPPLAANLAASKQDIRQLTIEAFDLLVSHVDNTVLIPHFTLAATNHANVKVKIAILQHLADIVGSVYQVKPHIVMKHVLPFAFRLLDERKGEMRTSNARLVQSLYRTMGDSLLESASKNDQTKLLELLSS